MKAKKASKKANMFLKEIKDKSDEEMLQIAEQYLINHECQQQVIEAIKKSIEEKPEENGTKYLIAAENLQGAEAVDYYKKGIEVLEKDQIRIQESSSEETKGEEEKINIPSKIASALSSIAELYMTPPLCDLPEAEETCEGALQKAFEIENDNLDALQCLANLRIMRARDEEAIELLDRVLKTILEKQELGDPQEMPSIDFRLQTSRLYMELEQFKKAVKPLDTVIKEDDNKGETWYLLAFCHYNLKNYQNANECLTNALECPDLTEELKEASTELLESMKGENLIAGDTSVSEGVADEEEIIDDEDLEKEFVEEDPSDDEDVEMQ
ncbi:unnamed protein product [Moneuplotes crassus]|uniref:Uncharacterized protein n=1 Tax=Euplotes crassus TaxID=5936 RepID=A0AAD2CZ04_EUPCR|nr:unnamed protein product [Moneuplotes crassus]